MIPGPAQPRTSGGQEEVQGAAPVPEEDPWRPTLAASAHPIPSVPTGQQLPSAILTQAVFEEAAGRIEGGGSRRPSVSPAPGPVSHDPGAGTRLTLPNLTFPPPPPPRGRLPTDPIYYLTSTSASSAPHRAPPPGPPLPPISWGATRAPGGSQYLPPLASTDRREHTPPQTLSLPHQPSSRRHSPPSPVAGPSRLPEEAPPRKRKARAKKSQPAIPTAEAGPSSSGAPALRRRHGSDDTTRGESCVSMSLCST